MAILTAYFQYDFSLFDLNRYEDDFDTHLLERDVNNPWEDNYTIFTGEVALELLGRGFGWEGSARAHMVKGTVEAFSEWFWDDVELEWIEAYHVADVVEVASSAVNDALRTNNRGDDLDVLATMLSGNDRFNLSDGNDKAKGFGGNDKMYGFAGRDDLRGDEGKDRLFGGDDNDVLRGGDDNDILRGGAGRDKEIGGEGADIFKFKTGDEKSIIKDFDATSARHDVIDLRGLASVNSWSDLTKNHMEQDGDDVRIDGGNGDIIVIRDVALESLDKADFLF